MNRNHRTIVIVLLGYGIPLPYHPVLYWILFALCVLLPLLVVPYTQEFIRVFFSREVSQILATLLTYIVFAVLNKIAPILSLTAQ